MDRVADLGLLVPCDLANQSNGERLVQTLAVAAPDWYPAVYSDHEPILKPFELRDVDFASNHIFLWKGRDRRIQGGCFSLGFMSTGYSKISIHLPVSCADGTGVGVLRALAASFEPTFGYLHLVNSFEFGPQSHGAIIHLGGGKLLLDVTVEILDRGIPDLYWATVLGPPLTGDIEPALVMTAPVHEAEELAAGLFYLQLTPTISDMEYKFDAVARVREGAKRHLAN